jgi:hypothetical protein
MYDRVVNRTQIYLSDAEVELLDAAERETGASRSELIRRAVRATFGGGGTDERRAALRRGAGIWARRPLDGAAYVDAVRGDLDDRLARLGLE